MKSVKIAVYVNIALSIYKIDYTLKYLEYMCSVTSPLRRHRLLLHSHP